MRTFAELLREYTTRTGISDAELARTLGVRRQTVFRWKEGLVARPRDVADVLRCAARLRLTPQERDELLMAAGFPPEGTSPPTPPLKGEGSTPSIDGPPKAGSHPATTGLMPLSLPPPSLVGKGAGGLGSVIWPALAVLLLALAFILYLAFFRGRDGRYPTAGPDETLIVIGQFVNYAGGSQGYNVAGRIQEALAREIAAARLTAARVAVWPETVGDEAAARDALARARASLVIWGEYDSGRVLARFTAAGASSDGHRLLVLAASPAELSATINSTLPEEVRYLALLTVGQLYTGQGDHMLARAVLTQALGRPPADATAQATLLAALGYTYQVGQPADLERAIDFYTRALALGSESISLHNNRGLAYLRRGQPGDLERAVADLAAVVAALPNNAAAYINRGAARLQIGDAADVIAAVADFDRAISLRPDALEAYFNRGLAYVRLGEPDRWAADFERVLAVAPDHAGAHSALCWAYALERQPASALLHCERGVALDPTGHARDSRGIVYAELGRFAEAISDLEVYLSALRQGDGALYARYAPKREAWIAALRAGRDPFDRDTLAALREE